MRQRRLPRNHQEKLLKIFYELVRGVPGVGWEKEELAVRLWERYPEVFGMRKFPHPNTAMVYAELSKSESSGFLERTSTGTYAMTPEGVKEASFLGLVVFKQGKVVEVTERPEKKKREKDLTVLTQPYPDLASFWTKVLRTTRTQEKQEHERSSQRGIRRESGDVRRGPSGGLVVRTEGSDEVPSGGAKDGIGGGESREQVEGW